MAKPTPIAQSRFRQMRIVATQETSGRVSYSIMAKPLNVQWNEHQILVRDSLVRPPFPLVTSEDVYVLLIDLLRDQLLPGVHI